MSQLIDNINYLLGDSLKENLEVNARLKIASGCFSIYAYEALKKELSGIESLEFLFTSPTFIAEKNLDKSFSREKREFYIPKLGRERSLYGTEFEVALKNQLTQKAIAKECAQWIRKKVTFKSITTNEVPPNFIHLNSKESDITYQPVEGFTASDLGYQNSNRHPLIMPIKEKLVTDQFLNRFDQFWQDTARSEDVTETICEYIESVYEENAPERIYFIILYNIFYEYLKDLDEGFMPNEKTGFQETLIWDKLFDFQKDAVKSIINKLDTYNGCILADSVGLGKTFTALAVIKYYELRNKNVLVLCPKRLAANWQEFNQNLKTNIFFQDRFNYTVLAHTDLDRTTGESFGIPLDRINWGNYDLVVIDESHNFRNNELNKDRETRYHKLMRKVIKEGVETKVLMLSATPVNNRFLDLRNQLALAYEGKSEVLRKKLNLEKGIESIFSQAQGAFNRWSELPAHERTADTIQALLDNEFFVLLDSVTIARSRKQIQKYYDISAIGPFPKRRKPLSFRSPITTEKSWLDFTEIFEMLRSLQLSVYQPLKFVYPSRMKKYEELFDSTVEGKGTLKQVDREKALVGLMTTNLLKRLESSVHSFRLTLESLERKHSSVLETIERFKSSFMDKVKSRISIAGASFNDIEDDEILPENDLGITVGKDNQISLEDMDIDSWERELRGDLEQIHILLSFLKEVPPAKDQKLQHLITQVKEKIQNPINPGNRKVIIFSAFADTAEYLYQQLAPIIHAEFGLHSAVITGGSTKPKTTLKLAKRAQLGLQDVLTLFSPISKGKAFIYPDLEAEIDLIIATDCISEGQNLQDCDYLINYDIHWNPVRIIQRFGRIDRIGSTNEEIQLVNYWPDIDLDEYINLKERVEGRMVISDMAATADDNLLGSDQHDVGYREEQLKRMQTEVIDLEDVKTGVSITDLGLNEYRMDLHHLIEKYGEPKNVPLGLHAVIPARNSLGLTPGIIFALKNVNTPNDMDRKNRIHPYYLVYIGNDGELILDQFKVKEIFDLLRLSCNGSDMPFSEICKQFNQKTQDGRDMSHCSALLSKSIRDMVEVNDEKDIDSLFSMGETTALENDISGLDDFELLAFIVVEEAG